MLEFSPLGNGAVPHLNGASHEPMEAEAAVSKLITLGAADLQQALGDEAFQKALTAHLPRSQWAHERTAEREYYSRESRRVNREVIDGRLTLFDILRTAIRHPEERLEVSKGILKKMDSDGVNGSKARREVENWKEIDGFERYTLIGSTLATLWQRMYATRDFTDGGTETVQPLAVILKDRKNMEMLLEALKQNQSQLTNQK